MRSAFVYREEQPAAPAIDALWTLDVGREVAPVSPYLTVPDGSLDLLYRFRRDERGRMESASLLIAGPTDRPETFFPRPGEHFVGVRFAPGWGAEALGVSALDLYNTHVEARTVTPALRTVEETLFACASPHDVLLRVREAAKVWSASPATGVVRAVAAMRTCGGQMTVEEAARCAGTSPRSFRRAVRTQVGLSPKTLLRIFRFRRALARLGAARLSEIAASCGYADQAHMSREFRALGGFSPREPRPYAGRAEGR